MKVLSIILGILLALGGLSCMFTPVATVLYTGYFMAILLLIYGIIGIVNVIKKIVPAYTLVVSIIAVIIGIIALVRPGSTLVLDAFMIFLFAAWFVIQGVISIVVSITSRREVRGWYWQLIIGIISVIIGIYSFFHPSVSLVAVGILIGIYLLEAGISMIIIGSVMDNGNGQM